MTQPVDRPSYPTSAIVLLILGGFVGLPYVTFVAFLSVGILGACLGPTLCLSSVGLLIAIYWGLLALAIVTVVTSIVMGIWLYVEPRYHRTVGGITLGLSVATIVGLSAFLGDAIWLVLAFLGGWCLFLIIAGGALAVLWRPRGPTRIPAGAVD